MPSHNDNPTLTMPQYHRMLRRIQGQDKAYVDQCRTLHECPLHQQRSDTLLQQDDEKLRRAIERYSRGAKLDLIERMTGGVSADVYRFDLTLSDGAKKQVILRIHGETHDGHEAELEFRLLEALHKVGVSVPRPLAIDASCTILEHPYLIITFVEGSTCMDQSMVETCIRSMVEGLISVHETPKEALPRLPSRIDPVPELLSFLPIGAEWNDFREFLSKLKSSPFTGSDVVLHGDYWPSNLIWSGGRIAAILDWEDAAFGDPLSDVACACLELRYIYGKEGMVLFKNAYAERCSIEPSRLALWLAYVSAAALKYIGDWGLESNRETNMRQTAYDTLKESASSLL